MEVSIKVNEEVQKSKTGVRWRM